MSDRTTRDAPAWSAPFEVGRRPDLARPRPLEGIDREAAWGGSTGAGVTVAILDSGVEGAHPAVGGRLVRSVRVEIDAEGEPFVVEDEPVDVFGHGTACAGLIHALAPEAALVSVRVLGPNNRGRGLAFARGLDWVVGEGIAIANLSLASRREELFATFHDLADRAYFGNTLLVGAATNAYQTAYPGLFASVVSVAAHDVPDPWTFFHNPRPPVEFGAWGVNVPVAWQQGGRIVATGNSFATANLTGLATLVRARHPDARPFEVKALLAAAASRP